MTEARLFTVEPPESQLSDSAIEALAQLLLDLAEDSAQPAPEVGE